MAKHLIFGCRFGGGIICTIKANYYKMSATNICENYRHNYMSSGVLIEYDEHSEAKTD